jgi:hypothetical protein
MGLIEKTASWQRHAFGSQWDKNIYKDSFGYTHTFKMVAAASATAVLNAATAGAATTTIVDNITDPDVPRVLKVTMGTAAGIGDGTVTVTGHNVEGATITEVFDIADGSTAAVNGTKAFKTVASVRVAGMKGTCTVSVGYTNGLGVRHRLFSSNTTVRVVQDTGSARTIQAAPTITDADDQHIEKNIITPATAPDGTTFLTIYYAYDHWSLGDLNDNPVYLTTTSTSSTSSSTSTTAAPTTSTSSTSVSTSSTSSSTSSTSSSTSSTSTSTTTTP